MLTLAIGLYVSVKFAACSGVAVRDLPSNRLRLVWLNLTGPFGGTDRWVAGFDFGVVVCVVAAQIYIF